jgi:hypothetical protein
MPLLESGSTSGRSLSSRLGMGLTPGARGYLVVFLTALLLRSTAATLFVGSIDTVNSMVNSVILLGGHHVRVPYLPTFSAVLWFSGVVAAYFPIPWPLAMKAIPVLFDSLLAVLIADIVAERDPKLAIPAGMLYAANPISLLITSFHGQWDAIALFFLLLAFTARERAGDDRAGDWIFGSLLAASLLVKPIALPFLLLIPRYESGRIELHGKAFAAAALVLGAALAGSYAYGYSPTGTLTSIFRYSASGVTIFGLPFALPAAWLPHVQGLRLLWIVPVMGVLGYFHFRGRLAVNDTLLLFYLFCLASSGIAPQYLIWPVPLLCASGRMRIAAAYSLIVVPFLLLYYCNPWASYFPFENLATFAPLREFAWLAPPQWLGAKGLLPYVQAFGNVIIPLTALAVAIGVLMTARRPRETRCGSRQWLAWTGRYTFPAIVLVTLILAATLTANPEYARQRLLEAWMATPTHYTVYIRSYNPAMIVIDPVKSSPANVIVLLGILTLGWCVVAARTGSRKSTCQHSAPLL